MSSITVVTAGWKLFCHGVEDDAKALVPTSPQVRPAPIDEIAERILFNRIALFRSLA
jgi:hypothetical protein